MERESKDEMGLLVDSFNQMTLHLHSSNKSLAETHAALQKSSQESEQRRRYTEIILQNVSAGVISLDINGQITTINRFAEKLLNIDKSLFVGLNFRDVLIALSGSNNRWLYRGTADYRQKHRGAASQIECAGQKLFPAGQLHSA